MVNKVNNFFWRILRVERDQRSVRPMGGTGRRALSTYQKTLAMHIAATTKSTGRGLAR